MKLLWLQLKQELKFVSLKTGAVKEGEKIPRPAAVTIYEDGIRYHFYAPIGVPLAELIPIVEATKDLTPTINH